MEDQHLPREKTEDLPLESAVAEAPATKPAEETAALDSAPTTELERPTDGAGDAAEKPLEVEATTPRPLVADAADKTAVADAAPASTDAERPHLKDVTGTLGDYVKNRMGALGTWARGHRVAVGLLVVLFVAVVGLVTLAFVHASGTPGKDVIRRDALSRVSAPAYNPGTFGADDILVAREAEVISSRRTATALESESARFGASGYAEADVTVTFSGTSVRADKRVTLGYAHVDRTWEGIGGEVDAKVTWEALSGVDQKKVLANIDTVFDRAEGTAAGSSGQGERVISLAALYEGAKLTVVEETFDAEAQTDTLRISCEKTVGFESYECELSVVFSFRPASGQWEISEASVSERARELSLKPLVGTWTGTFQSQTTEGTKCLAAGGEEGGLTVEVKQDATSSGISRITGSITGLAHYHEHPAQDAQSTSGDHVFENVSFTATLSEATSGRLVFEATLPEEVDGSVTVTLTFGTETDPDAVLAEVTTTYPHTGSFLFIPFEETLTYTDTFELVRAE